MKERHLLLIGIVIFLLILIIYNNKKLLFGAEPSSTPTLYNQSTTQYFFYYVMIHRNDSYWTESNILQAIKNGNDLIRGTFLKTNVGRNTKTNLGENMCIQYIAPGDSLVWSKYLSDYSHLASNANMYPLSLLTMYEDRGGVNGKIYKSQLMDSITALNVNVYNASGSILGAGNKINQGIIVDPVTKLMTRDSAAIPLQQANHTNFIYNPKSITWDMYMTDVNYVYNKGSIPIKMYPAATVSYNVSPYWVKSTSSVNRALIPTSLPTGYTSVDAYALANPTKVTVIPPDKSVVLDPYITNVWFSDNTNVISSGNQVVVSSANNSYSITAP